MSSELEEEVAVLLRASGLTVATAESATGGMIASMIMNVPGSSDYYKGSVIAYANEAKENVLRVKGDTLRQYSSVSRQVGGEMAEGVRRLINTDIGLSDTGIAGPGGATPEKPVGLFYIGLSSGEETRVEEHIFRGDRQGNRRAAAEAALKMLKKYLLELKRAR